jgi:2-polyprenyl-6-methoxyphenol hydroxylase-like FAD-dependent oxidoreductase
LARTRNPAYVDQIVPYSPERSCGCAQIFYDPILLACARTLPTVTIRHMTGLDSFTQDDNVVHARVTDTRTGRSETITARYLVGCDGAGGAVPKALGVAYEGLGVVANSVNVYLRSAALARIHDKGWARFYRFTDRGGSWGELIGIDGKELYRLSVLKADPAFDGDAYVRRLAGTDVAYEILSVLAWERRECVADRYRDRRVFIAGDAAHQNSPTGGLGLHTGLADAVDLGWKLVAVLQGWGGGDLLDAYEAERKPVAVNNVRASTGEFRVLADLPSGPEIAEDSPRGADLRRRFAEVFRRTGQVRMPTYTENLRLGYCYEPSPIVIPDGTTKPPVETPAFVPVARPGTRAPHAWIAEGRSILDLFGRGFVLLRLGRARPDANGLVAAAVARGVPLDVVDLADPAIAQLYERRLVLVRPDGHVAWRGDDFPDDPAALMDRVRGAATLTR